MIKCSVTRHAFDLCQLLSHIHISTATYAAAYLGVSCLQTWWNLRQNIVQQSGTKRGCLDATSILIGYA